MNPEDRLIADVADKIRPLLDGRLRVDDEPLGEAAFALVVKEMIAEMRSAGTVDWHKGPFRIDINDRDEMWLWVRAGRLTPRVHKGVLH